MRTKVTTAVFSPAKEKSGSPGIARGNAIASAVAGAREPVDRGAARVAEPEETRDLVERLAGGVVDGLAEHLVVAVPADDDEQGVTTGHEHDRERRGELRILEPSRVEVGLEVVDTDVREAGHERERLRRAHADEQRAREAGTVARGDGADVGELESGFTERVGDHRVDELDVRPARDLGHDTAVLRVELDLARHDRRQHAPAVLDDGRGRFVARRLDAQDVHQRRGSS